MNNNFQSNLFIVGYPKTGTTSLFEILAMHPKIAVSSEKEPGDWQHLRNFDPDHPKEYINYIHNFMTVPNAKYYLDGTTRYILNEDAAGVIKNYNSCAKIIIGLREPVEYLASMCYQIGINTGIPADFVRDMLDRSCSYADPNYFNSVEKFISVFGRESVFVYTLEDLIGDPVCINRNLMEFLGLEVWPVEMPKKNASLIGKSALHAKLYKYLVYGAIPSQLRRTLKSLGISNIAKTREIFDRVFLKKSSFKMQLLEENPLLAHEIKMRFQNDVRQLSVLLGRDFETLWGY